MTGPFPAIEDIPAEEILEGYTFYPRIFRQ